MVIPPKIGGITEGVSPKTDDIARKFSKMPIKGPLYHSVGGFFSTLLMHHLYSGQVFKLNRTAALAEWR